jgi:ribosome-associated heat shock protein Hsp15
VTDCPPTVRLDKWLWAVRVFKTRSIATHACSAGHVKILGHNVKPSHIVRPGEIVSARVGDLTRTLKVLAPLQQRVAAKVVPQYAEDLTPAIESQKAHEPKFTPLFTRPKGAGRPTKKDRRSLDQLGW